MVDPQIMNNKRAEMGVGSDLIQHVHQYHPNIPSPREPQPEESIEDTKLFTPEKTPLIVQMFRSAIRGVRGGRYDTTET